MTNLIDKWELTGLLEGLGPEDMEILSNYLEDARLIILEMDEKNLIEDFATENSLVIIARIYHKILWVRAKKQFELGYCVPPYIFERYKVYEMNIQEIIDKLNKTKFIYDAYMDASRGYSNLYMEAEFTHWVEEAYMLGELDEIIETKSGYHIIDKYITKENNG